MRTSNLVCIRWLSWSVEQYQEDTVKDWNRTEKLKQRQKKWKDTHTDTKMRGRNRQKLREDETNLRSYCWERNERRMFEVIRRNSVTEQRELRGRPVLINSYQVPAEQSLHTGANTCQHADRVAVEYGKADRNSFLFCFHAGLVLPLWAHLSGGFPLSVLLVYAAELYMCAFVFLAPETRVSTF